MPELPEVETIVRDLAPRLEGQTLRNPRLHKTDVLRGVTPRKLLAALRKREISRVFRRAKHVVFQLEGDRYLIVQPRMTGTLIVYDRPLTAAERRYVVLEAALDPDGLFVYRDVRRLGTISLLDDEQWRSYTARIGPEPLADDFTADRFGRQLGSTRQAIKKALMDQRLIAGVGNIYANEALFRARIDPSIPANELEPRAVTRLHEEVLAVLTEAVAANGTTVRDYRTGTGASGSFQTVLRVYGRGGEPCMECGTVLTTTHAIDARATTFCWRCQGSREHTRAPLHRPR